MMAYSETFRVMTRDARRGRGCRLCGGRLVLSHEGLLAGVRARSAALPSMEELSGVKTAVDDPMAAWAASVGGQDLEPHQDAIIRRRPRRHVSLR